MVLVKKIVVGSTQNLASRNIAKALEGRTDVTMLDSSIVDLEKLDCSVDLVIVASSHSSVSGKPTLTAHTPGNFGPAKMGGDVGILSISPALYVGEAVRKFKELQTSRKLPYDVSLEVTHHGPSFSVPIVFVEVGSTEKQWEDQKAIEAAADVIIHLLDFTPVGKSMLGIGGTHYTPYFTKKMLEGLNFGHICPKYASEFLTKDMLIQMIEKTNPRPEEVWIDWKGTPGGLRQDVRQWTEELGLKAVKC